VVSVSEEIIEVIESSQIGQARRAAVRLAELSGLSDDKRSQVAIVATELATNLVRYGRNGRFFLQSAQQPGGSYLQMLAMDSGPGIDDVNRSLQDGVSTGGTYGAGLGAVKRLSDVFDIYSIVNEGTLVLSRVTATPAPATGANGFQWAAISTPAPRETVCGDIWRVAEDHDTLSVMVADGLGHGPLAAEASSLAAAVFDGTPRTDPTVFCREAHTALSGSRGAALAMGVVNSGAMVYAGIGNISGTLVAGEKSRGLSSQNGIVGVTPQRARAFTYDWPDGGVLVMHSDGLTNRWSLCNYRGLGARHPALIAGVLYRDCLRGRDDATIVVVKKTAGH
jgi:anti-sigma regulatory factor (Ser/Thr protein kinase)